MSRLVIWAVVVTLLSWTAAKAQPPAWIEQHARSIVQVTFLPCHIRPCEEGRTTGTPRLASGFLFRLPNGTVGILTALHAVCGDGLKRYRFGSISGDGLGTALQETSVELAHAGHDLALLRITATLPPGVVPLEAEYRADPRGLQATILGHAERAPKVLDSRADIRSLARQLNAILAEDLQIRLARLGFPDLSQAVIGVQNAIAPGDSGAPLIAPSGRVVGVANGGVPAAGTYISWAIPIDAVHALRPASEVLPQVSCAGLDSAQRSAEVDQIFYLDQLMAGDRPLRGGVLQAHLVLRLATAVGPLRAYANWLREKVGFTLPRESGAAFGAAPIAWNAPLSPRNLPSPDGAALLDTFARLRVRLACFDAASARRVQAATQPTTEGALLVVEIPIGPLEPGFNHAGVLLSLSDHFNRRLVNLHRASWIMVDPYVPGTRLQRRFTRAADLLGGSCRVDLDDQPGRLSWQEAAMLDGMLRLTLMVSETVTLTMLHPALIPAGTHGERWEIWGQLPLRPDPLGVDPMAFAMWR
ncbi:S1 family peptidase [Falsiroseomonas selenitidurans]|uniref:Trypsin-like peptidase domain-containing protein n=1 Tax=Falsiroseomonas selenitidurans TaxID=2716335 RepID=A0ABX1E7Z0_9PROT|nr:serine protease [Falsiroseomonas selenitidurans]NKC33335.1 trypsin-like peptidase domain-containing protein [Falsiroseomonas selenitidurans]